MGKIDEIKNKLKLNNLRVTQSRIAVAKILIKNKNNFLTCDEIYSRVCNSKSFNCDRASIYRILGRFVEIELVVKSDFLGEASHYQLKDKALHRRHEHFFKCIDCNNIEVFEGCMLLSKEKELEKQGYSNLGHHLEIRGSCPSCVS